MLELEAIRSLTKPSAGSERRGPLDARVLRGFAAAVVIPTYNHGKTVAAVVESAAGFGNSVIVVDDGSTDGTDRVLSQWIAEHRGTRCEVRRHPKNLGKAAALMTGFAAAQELGYTHVVTIDADGQHDARDIPLLLRAAQKDPAALILGARPAQMAECPQRCARGRMFAGLAVRMESGLTLADTQCGLRVYPLELVKKAGCTASRFSFEAEIIVRAAWCGAPVIEVPVRCIYFKPEQRVSHFRPWRDSVHQVFVHLGLLARWLVTGLIGRSEEITARADPREKRGADSSGQGIAARVARHSQMS